MRQVLFCTYGFQNKIKILSYDLLLFSAWFIEKEFDLSVKIVTKIDSTDENSDVSHFFMSHRLGFSGSQTKFWNVRNANIQRRLFGIIGFQRRLRTIIGDGRKSDSSGFIIERIDTIIVFIFLVFNMFLFGNMGCIRFHSLESGFGGSVSCGGANFVQQCSNVQEEPPFR